MHGNRIRKFQLIKLNVRILHPSGVIIHNRNGFHFFIDRRNSSDFTVKNSFARCFLIARSFILDLIVVLILHHTVADPKDGTSELKLVLFLGRRVKGLLEMLV